MEAEGAGRFRAGTRETIQNSYRAQKANRQLLIAYIVLLGVQTIFMWIICAFGFHYAGGMAFFLLPSDDIV